MRWWRSATERRACPDWLTARPYAHRGLHGGGIVENSRAAFEAAIARNFGIELDVRPTRCGTPFVFHDAGLQRLCGIDRQLRDFDSAAAGELMLSGSSEAIPTLEEVLALVAGRVPLLVEVKSDGRIDATFVHRLARLLVGYRGSIAFMSFDPRLVEAIGRYAIRLPFGLVITEQDKSKVKGLIERRLAVSLMRPDFLAYDIRSLPSPFAAAQRRRGRPVLSWTVRTDAEAATARQHADQIIHEWTGAR